MSLAWGVQPLPELPHQEVISLRDRRPRPSQEIKKVAKTNAISNLANTLNKEENPAAFSSVEEPGVPYSKENNNSLNNKNNKINSRRYRPHCPVTRGLCWCQSPRSREEEVVASWAREWEGGETVVVRSWAPRWIGLGPGIQCCI